MRHAVVGLMVAVGMCMGAAPAADLPATPFGYALFGLEDVSIGSKQQVHGDVGSSAGHVSLGQGTRVSGGVAAPVVSVGKGARASAYYCTDLRGSADACTAFPNPLVDPASLLVVQVTPGAADVSLKKRAKQTSPLAPGGYGRLEVGAASQLVLAGGQYSFASVAIGARAKVQCAAACEIDIRTKLTIGQAARFGAAAGVPAGGVLVKVQADGESTAVETRSRATIAGSVYAPTGLVKLGGAGRYEGAFVGQTVNVGPRARVTGPSGT